MKILLLSIRETRAVKSKEMATLVDLYLTRATKYSPTESQTLPTEQAFWDWIDRQSARTPAITILLDSRGKQLSSEDLAARFAQLQRDSAQLLILAIGPANGWSSASRQRASQLLSLGPMTLPHELARLVLAEQIYRALTILANHPYHSGH